MMSQWKKHKNLLFSASLVLVFGTCSLVAFELSTNPSQSKAIPAPLQSDSGSRKQEASVSERVSWYVISGSGQIPSAFTLHAYDSAGRHTGPIPVPNRPTALVLEEQIPSGSFSQVGDNVSLTLSTDDQYRIEIQGRTIGDFKLRVALLDSHYHEITSFDYAGGTVSPASRASLVLPKEGFEMPPDLIIDSDGDGKPDTRQKPMLSPID